MAMIGKKNWQDWASVGLLLIGATLLALNISTTKWAFPILGIARIWLSVLMWNRRDYPLFVMNFFYVIVDIIGIIRWF